MNGQNPTKKNLFYFARVSELGTEFVSLDARLITKARRSSAETKQLGKTGKKSVKGALCLPFFDLHAISQVRLLFLKKKKLDDLVLLEKNAITQRRQIQRRVIRPLQLTSR